jgi:hypothetical protein
LGTEPEPVWIMGRKSSKRKEKETTKETKRSAGHRTREIDVSVDSGRDGITGSDVANGHRMIASFIKLFTYLRAEGQKDHLVDSYSLWLDANDSDDEPDDIPVDEIGMITVDARLVLAQRSTKKIKKAVKRGNPELMPIEELQADLKERGLSERGDKGRLAARLNEALEAEAAAIRETTRVVNHFNSQRTKLNIQTLVTKPPRQFGPWILGQVLRASTNLGTSLWSNAASDARWGFERRTQT